MLAGLALVLALFAASPSIDPSAPLPVVCCRHGGHSGGHSDGHRSYSGRSHAPRLRSSAPRVRSSSPRIRAPRSSTPRAYRAPRSRSPRLEGAPRANSYRAPRAPRALRTPRAPRSTTTHAPGARDSHGRLKRSEAATDAFKRQTGHPHGWPGHVIDHIKPLACGGADAPSNMQWQTIADAKAKDRVERSGCGR